MNKLKISFILKLHNTCVKKNKIIIYKILKNFETIMFIKNRLL